MQPMSLSRDAYGTNDEFRTIYSQAVFTKVGETGEEEQGQVKETHVDRGGVYLIKRKGRGNSGSKLCFDS